MVSCKHFSKTSCCLVGATASSVGQKRSEQIGTLTRSSNAERLDLHASSCLMLCLCHGEGVSCLDYHPSFPLSRTGHSPKATRTSPLPLTWSLPVIAKNSCKSTSWCHPVWASGEYMWQEYLQTWLLLFHSFQVSSESQRSQFLRGATKQDLSWPGLAIPPGFLN